MNPATRKLIELLADHPERVATFAASTLRAHISALELLAVSGRRAPANSLLFMHFIGERYLLAATPKAITADLVAFEAWIVKAEALAAADEAQREGLINRAEREAFIEGCLAAEETDPAPGRFSASRATASRSSPRAGATSSRRRCSRGRSPTSTTRRGS